MTYEKYAASDRLIDNKVYSIAVDSNGEIWASTLKKIPLYGELCNYDGENWEIYTRNDGLKSDCIYSIACSANGDVWFRTDCGISRV